MGAHRNGKINLVIRKANTVANLVVPVENRAHKNFVLKFAHCSLEVIHVKPLHVELGSDVEVALRVRVQDPLEVFERVLFLACFAKLLAVLPTYGEVRSARLDAPRVIIIFEETFLLASAHVRVVLLNHTVLIVDQALACLNIGRYQANS